ncbi:acyltransferase family protein [Nonomuraea rhodomycinica]|uniref:Acyltransferase family protein n=1 Tax=Nonomuraea rhodomycinica TaxID=1712872 RepID=A0A7Y6MCZ7_9ACTN|nr:acyltransferase family protein [Nonomuraea rhodomycinica]NUW42271.1 acyltransferase family protein [Nonomuraea rhodomycinica]
MDFVRVLVVVGLVLFHSSLVFDASDDFYVKNPETTGITTIFAGFGVLWAMPLLFLIAGFGAWHSLRRRGPGGFVLERLRRIGVPLVFGTTVLVPVPQWLRLRADPAYHESYLKFLPRFFHIRVEPWEFPFVLQGDSFETGHLWFLLLLLTFALMLAPVVRWYPASRARALGERLAAVGRRRGAALLPALPLALVSAVLGLEEEYAGWSRWAYLVFFCYGVVLASDGRLREALRRDTRAAVVCGLLLPAVGLPLFLVAEGDAFTDLTPMAMTARALYGAAGWCWLVVIMSLLQRRRPAPGRATSDGGPSGGSGRRLYAYLSEGVLPLYVLHQPIVVVVAFWVVRWPVPGPVKFVAIVLVSLALILAAYDLLVRRAEVTRFLFGMRPARRRAQRTS